MFNITTGPNAAGDVVVGGVNFKRGVTVQISVLNGQIEDALASGLLYSSPSLETTSFSNSPFLATLLSYATGSATGGTAGPIPATPGAYDQTWLADFAETLVLSLQILSQNSEALGQSIDNLRAQVRDLQTNHL